MPWGATHVATALGVVSFQSGMAILAMTSHGQDARATASSVNLLSGLRRSFIVGEVERDGARRG